MATPGFTADDPIALTIRLVETPSVSGGEAAIVGFIHEGLRGLGIEAELHGRNAWCVIDGARPGPRTLLLQAHVDTVPPTDAWTGDPWRVKRADGRLRGLGTNDTKGGAAAMLCVIAEMARTRDFAGRLVFAATCDEETGGEGLEVLRPELPPLTGAVIAEPTRLRAATAQRGLMRVVVRCDGRSAHAARPWQGENAIHLATADIAALCAIDASPPHALLGPSTLTPTLIEGGVKPNVVPPTCRFTIDVRPTPDHDNDWWEHRIRAVLTSEIEVMKKRLTPVETPTADPLVQAALAATATDEPVPFGGMSDLWHVRDVAGVVLGPGRPEQSHQADEWVEESQVLRAVEVYRDLVTRYLVEEDA